MLRLNGARGWLSIVLSCSLASSAAAQTTWYVDDDAAPGGSGLAWHLAFDSLDSALQSAGNGDEIWVAEGRYRPTVEQEPGTPRSKSFLVPQGAAMYGGFAGNEATLDARAGLYRRTVLSGDIGTLFDSSDNAFHVVTVNNPSGIPVGVTSVDGFTITEGRGGQGGGLMCFNSGLKVANCIFLRNHALWGGAIHAQPGAVRIKWCEFRENHAENRGGAIWGQSLTYRISNCLFAGNTCDDKGGAIYLHSIFSEDNVAIANSAFHDNSAARGGALFLGGTMFSAGHANVRNCTFAYNSASDRGGAIYANTVADMPARGFVHNSVLWGNSAPLGEQVQGRLNITYSNVQDRCCGLGNISADPMFVDPAGRDLGLLPGSPCIDASANARVSPDYTDVDGDGISGGEQTELDLAVMPRFFDDPATPDTGAGLAPIADMGAYEYLP